MGSKSWQRFGALFLPALLGVVVLIATTASQLRAQLAALPEAPDIPFPALLALSIVQPALLVALAVALGLLFAPRIGLHSHLVARASGTALPAFWNEVPLALGLGGIAAVVLAVLDTVTLPWLGPGGDALSLLGNRTLEGTIAGVLYGGVTEEVLIRWGLMPLFAAGICKLFGQPKDGTVRATVMWPAIVVAALFFGAGHLPLVSQTVPLTGIVIARTLLLNGIAGLFFGWLFWRRSLEAAMVAHAAVHIVWSALSWFE